MNEDRALSVSGALKEYYSSILKQYGSTSRGMDWSDEEEHFLRLRVLYSIKQFMEPVSTCSILDVGCGAGFLLDVLKKQPRQEAFIYKGLDISPEMISAAQERHPEEDFSIADAALDISHIEQCDIAILNGVLTEKLDTSHRDMRDYAKSMISAVYDKVNFGIAFNVMSTHGTPQVEKFFHWPLDDCASFITSDLSANFLIRKDYGVAEEYCVYIFRQKNGI